MRSVLKNRILIAIITIFIGIGFTFPQNASAASYRKKFLIYVSAFGDPFPAVPGFNLGYEPTRWFRFVGGYGVTRYANVSASEIAVGFRILIPNRVLTPVVGLSYGKVRGLRKDRIYFNTALGEIGSVGQFSSDTYTYLSVGFEKNISASVFMGFGYSILTSGASGGGHFPFINLGLKF